MQKTKLIGVRVSNDEYEAFEIVRQTLSEKLDKRISTSDIIRLGLYSAKLGIVPKKALNSAFICAGLAK